MQYAITAPIPGLVPPGEIAAQAETAAEALVLAEEIARGGRRGVMITDPDGELFDLDQFRAIVQRSGCAEQALERLRTKGLEE
jgi:hypothetical protein